MCKEAEGQLARLAMPHARLQVELLPCRDGIPAGDRLLGPDGADRVRFLLAANPGESREPLRQVASGGEVARIMLALRGALAVRRSTPTLVFDEIDAGIGGRTAQRVGQVLAELARHHQVLCITHLPQIASMAASHYGVSKSLKKDRTSTEVRLLDKQERVDEIARMLGGVKITETTRKHAAELLANV